MPAPLKAMLLHPKPYLPDTASHVLQCLQGVSDVAWHPSGKHIATASDDNTIKLWVSSSGDLLKTLSGHTHYVFCCAFSPKGNLLASGSFDETIRIWDFSNGQCLKVAPLGSGAEKGTCCC